MRTSPNTPVFAALMSMLPPRPSLPVAPRLPRTSAVSLADSRMSPPSTPEASSTEPVPSSSESLAESTMRPWASRERLLASMRPRLITLAPSMPTAPRSAMSLPRFSAWLPGADTSIVTSSMFRLDSRTFWPAARMSCPPTTLSTPSFFTCGAISTISPPGPAWIIP